MHGINKKTGRGAVAVMGAYAATMKREEERRQLGLTESAILSEVKDSSHLTLYTVQHRKTQFVSSSFL